MRIFLFHPIISGYPNAKFPGVVVFSEIYQGINQLLRVVQLGVCFFESNPLTGGIFKKKKQSLAQSPDSRDRLPDMGTYVLHQVFTMISKAQMR